MVDPKKEASTDDLTTGALIPGRFLTPRFYCWAWT
jgi:hypothetical protein